MPFLLLRAAQIHCAMQKKHFYRKKIIIFLDKFLYKQTHANVLVLVCPSLKPFSTAHCFQPEAATLNHR